MDESTDTFYSEQASWCFFLVFSSIFVTLSLTKPEPPVHKWGCSLHCAQDLAPHIWLPFHGSALLILSGLWHPAIGHHGFLCYPHFFFFDTNNYAPHLVLPHLIVLELKCLGMEEKKGEGKEEHESPLFLKKKTKNFTVYRTFLSIVSNIIPLSSRFHSCYWQVSQSSLLLFECNVFYFSRLLLTLSHCLWFSFTCSFLCISLTWDSLHFVNLWDDVFL